MYLLFLFLIFTITQWWCWSYWDLHLHPLPAGEAENWGCGGYLPIHQVSTHTSCWTRQECGMVCSCSISLNYVPVDEIKWTVQFFLCGMLVCLVYTIDDNCCHLIDCPFYRSSTYCVIMCWLILWTVLKLMPILRIWCDAYTFGMNLIPNSTVNCNPYQFSYK